VHAPPSDLLAALDRGPLLLDGGIGSELAVRGRASGPCELLNVERPERVTALHEAYLAAGCDALTTNSFCADAPSLARRGASGRSAELGIAAARLARAAAGRAAAEGRPRWVLGSLGPGRDLPTLHGGDDAALERAYAELARALDLGGVDALLIETVRDVRQARAALAGALTAAPHLPRLVAFAPFADGALAGGVTLPAALARLAEFEPALLGVNCVEGAAGCERALSELRAAGARRLGAWPNAGLPDTSGPQPVWPLAPEPFARELAASARRHGLALVGGCCGTTPAHVRALAALLARGDARP
jgi:5-methyltetrahydrofolate--homocysteine methyltransferase